MPTKIISRKSAKTDLPKPTEEDYTEVLTELGALVQATAEDSLGAVIVMMPAIHYGRPVIRFKTTDFYGTGREELDKLMSEIKNNECWDAWDLS